MKTKVSLPLDPTGAPLSGFYQIYVAHSSNVSVSFARSHVERVLGRAFEWYRLSDTVWIVCTKKDAKIWYTRLGKLVKPKGHVLIVKLDVTDKAGWMPKAFWQWIKTTKAKFPGVA
jgi:hypothetical protein